MTWSGDPKCDKSEPDKSDPLAGYVFVGNDVGVWVGKRRLEQTRRGWKWLDISGNLPNVIVTDLVCHARPARSPRQPMAEASGGWPQKTWRRLSRRLEKLLVRNCSARITYSKIGEWLSTYDCLWIPKTPSGLKMQVFAPFVRSSSFPR